MACRPAPSQLLLLFWISRGIAPTNYLEAQNWLITTGRISSEAQSKLGGTDGQAESRDSCPALPSFAVDVSPTKSVYAQFHFSFGLHCSVVGRGSISMTGMSRHLVMSRLRLLVRHGVQL